MKGLIDNNYSETWLYHMISYIVDNSEQRKCVSYLLFQVSTQANTAIATSEDLQM